MTDLDGPFVLRNPARKFADVLWLFFIALSVFLVVNRQGGHKVVGAAGCVVFVVFFVLSWRSGVRCDRHGVVALDETGRRRLSWADIDHFEERGWRGIGAVKRSGRWVRLTGYATLGDVSPEKATALLEEQRLKFQDEGSRSFDGKP